MLVLVDFLTALCIFYFVTLRYEHIKQQKPAKNQYIYNFYFSLEIHYYPFYLSILIFGLIYKQNNAWVH